MTTKPCVCIHVTPSLDQLELALLSEDGGQIQHVASINFNLYDNVSRRLNQPEELATAIKQLFVTAKVPMGSLPTVLILPSYFSKNMSLTSNLNADDINMVLLSEVESHYIFKNQDPVLDWIKLDNNQILYTAFIADDINYWIAAFQELRIPLIQIDIGHFALIRGLMATGALQSVVEHDRPWMMVVLSDNNCKLGLFQGIQLRQAEDIPLGTEDTQMAVQDINQDIYRLLENYPIDQMILINNSLRIDVNAIKSTLTIDCPIIDIIQNKHSVESLGGKKESVQYPCTLEALGGVLTQQFPYLPQVNFAPRQGRNMLEADNAKHITFRWLIIGNVAVAALCAVTWCLIQGMVFFKNQQLTSINPPSAVNSQKSELAGLPGRLMLNEKRDLTGVVDENETYKKLLAKRLYERNTWVNNLLIAVGKNLPEDAWINEFMVDAIPIMAKTTVSIKGSTQSTDPMNTFQEVLSKQFEKNAPTLITIDADTNAASTYIWKMGLNLTDTTKTETAPTTGGRPG